MMDEASTLKAGNEIAYEINEIKESMVVLTKARHGPVHNPSGRPRPGFSQGPLSPPPVGRHALIGNLDARGQLAR